jgi:hypothetical protein
LPRRRDAGEDKRGIALGSDCRPVTAEPGLKIYFGAVLTMVYCA